MGIFIVIEKYEGPLDIEGLIIYS